MTKGSRKLRIDTKLRWQRAGLVGSQKRPTCCGAQTCLLVISRQATRRIPIYSDNSTLKPKFLAGASYHFCHDFQMVLSALQILWDKMGKSWALQSKHS
jgi:hypothetical protein